MGGPRRLANSNVMGRPSRSVLSLDYCLMNGQTGLSSMRRKLLLLLVGFAVAAGGLAVWFMFPEPSYEGKPLSYWMDPQGQQGEFTVDQFRAAIAGMGSKAVPYLVRRVNWRRGPMIQKFVAWIPNQPRLAGYIERRSTAQAHAVYALGILGPLARPALLSLEALEASGSIDPRSAYHLKFALASIREESLTPYFEKLADTSDPGWVESALIIGAFGTRATGAIPNLLAALGTTNSLNNALIQCHACQALASIHSRPDVCVPVLARLLESPDGDVRGMALFALRSFDRAAKPAWRELVRCLQDPVPWNRDAAAKLLKEIDFEGAAKAGPR